MAFLWRSPRSRATLLAVAAALVGVTGFAPRATAQVEKVGAASVGLQPRSTDLHDSADTSAFEDEGGPVVSSSSVYAIYWDPENAYHGNWQQIIDEFLYNMSESSGALSNVFAVDSQYTDPAGQHAASRAAFAGAYTDTDPYPAKGCTDPHPLLSGEITCLSGEQVQAELERFIEDHSLPTGMSTIYYVLTPPGVTECLLGGASERCSDYAGKPEEANPSYEESFCSYHAAINPSGAPDGGPETVLFAAIPWSAGGVGDYHLATADQTYAYECQDGGWQPQPLESEEGTAESYESEPLEQEPNQSGRGPDGSYDAGLADLIIGQIANEQQDIVTDPLLNGWQATKSVVFEPGREEHAGEEVTDLCRDFFAPVVGGSSGVETAQEKVARQRKVIEEQKKFEEAGDPPAEAKKLAEAAAPKPHHGEKGTEAGTLYNQELTAGRYYLNDAFNLAGALSDYPGVPCINGVSLVPSFTAPTDVNAGEIVGFDGMESDITLDAALDYSPGAAPKTYPVYEWNFGDGTSVKGYAPGAPSQNSPETTPCESPWLSPCAASTYHTYQYGGTYEVTLTVTDVGGHTASITKPIVVSGPAPPAPPEVVTPPAAAQTIAPPSTQTSSAAPKPSTEPAGSKGSKAGKKGGSGKQLSSPSLTALVVTKSTKALVRGLKVRYSVNEQAAGRFEVLLATSLAKRLQLKGSKASGLPQGSKPETVVAHALLVTTRSAHRTVEIQIPTRTARRLARLHSLTLTVKVSARDASASDPQVSILQTVAKLGA